ncbi:MAG: hypothetical protein FJX76_07215 [Armatimonadetes bacterium]|nr:hypothetical protein [Armatimonadota bacterium]
MIARLRMALAAAPVLALLATPCPVHAETPSTPDATQITEAVKRMEEGVPVIMRTLEILAREGPALQALFQKASVRAHETGLDRPITHTGPEGFPTEQEMTERYRGLQAVFQVLRESSGVFSRIQRDLPVRAPDAQK